LNGIEHFVKMQAALDAPQVWGGMAISDGEAYLVKTSQIEVSSIISPSFFPIF
jgi:hypothetical protein